MWWVEPAWEREMLGMQGLKSLLVGMQPLALALMIALQLLLLPLPFLLLLQLGQAEAHPHLHPHLHPHPNPQSLQVAKLLKRTLCQVAAAVVVVVGCVHPEAVRTPVAVPVQVHPGQWKRKRGMWVAGAGGVPSEGQLAWAERRE